MQEEFDKDEVINDPKQEQSPASKSLFSTFFRFFFRSVIAVLILLIVLIIAINIPIVQKWTLNGVTSYLSKELKTEIKADNVQLNFFNQFSLQNFSIHDAYNKELLFSKNLVIDYNIYKLINGVYQIDNVLLDSVTLNINRGAVNTAFNYQFLIDYFVDSKKKSNGPPLDLKLGNIYLRNTKFILDDKAGGSYVRGNVKGLDMHTRIMNLPKGFLDIDNLSIYKPDILILKRKPTLAEIDDKREKKSNSSPPKEQKYSLGNLHIEDGIFKMDDYITVPKRLVSDSLVDFKHLHLTSINVEVNKLLYFNGEITGEINGINLKEKSGFELQKLRASEAKFSNSKIEFNGIQIVTPNTYIGDTISLKFNSLASFGDFNNEVYLDGRFSKTKVAFKDILRFAHGLNNNAFFEKNKNENASLSGRIYGKINSLKAKDLEVALGSGLKLKGRFDSNNIAIKDEQRINAKIEELNTDIKVLRQLLPGFTPPSTFDKLGKVNFNGSFSGFFVDFVADGHLSTALGRVGMDMRLDLKGGKDNATYSGNLDVEDFDLAKWTGDTKFGKTSFAVHVNNGQGLAIEKARADLKGELKKFIFQNYQYKDISIKGNLKKNFFVGDFDVKDDNADLKFDGTVNFSGAIPIFDFKSKIKRIDLKKLNLSETDLKLSADLDMKMTGDLKTGFYGYANLNNLLIDKNNGTKIYLDSINLLSDKTKDGRKQITMNSDIFNMKIKGEFNLLQIPKSIAYFLNKQHPIFSKNIGLVVDYTTTLFPQDFDFAVKIKDSKNLTNIFIPNLDTIRDLEVSGSYNSTTQDLELVYGADKIKYQNYIFEGIAFDLTMNDRYGLSNLIVYHSQINGKDMAAIRLGLRLHSDTLITNIATDNLNTDYDLSKLRLAANIIPVGDMYHINFETSDLTLLKDEWKIKADNTIIWGKNHLEVNNFDMQSGDKRITINTTNTNMLNVEVQNYGLEYINNYITDKRFNFGGKYNIGLSSSDIFKLSDLKFRLQCDDFLINNIRRGSLDVSAETNSLKSPVKANVKIVDGDKKIDIDGYYYPKILEDNYKEKFKPNSINFDVSLKDYPLSTLNLLIVNGTYNTVGNIDAKMNVSGPLDNLNYDGDARIKNGGISISYLKTRILIKDEILKITNNKIATTKGIITDSLGNIGYVYGGLVHDKFRNIGLDVRIESPKFLMFNTTSSDNSLYYGKGIGSGTIAFSGDFDRTNLKIRAKTGQGTNVILPFNRELNTSGLTFVKFKQNQKIENATNATKEQKGMDVDMELEVTDDADMQLILDEKTGDNIKGRGIGNLHLISNRSGEFNMYGNYEIKKGYYLYTSLGLINKNFIINDGGSIKWDGNPFEAEINLTANYKGLTASPYNLISEYLTKDLSNIKTEALKSTNVDLKILLSGKLLKPNINFDIELPSLFGELRTYTDTKLRIMKQEPAEMNKQVVGLLNNFGFLSNNITFQLQSAGINTVSEYLSNQITALVNQSLSSSGIEVSAAYNQNQYNLNDVNGLRTSNEYRFGVTKYLFNDRLAITTKGNISNSNDNTGSGLNNNGTFVGGDFILEYDITADRKLKARLSQIRDQAAEGKRDRTSIGLNYRQDFDNFDELYKIIFGKKKKN
jgi:hypothetical protein